jgi:altronate dehydratase small subunit
MSMGKDAASWDAVQIASSDHVAVALRDLSDRVRVRRGNEIVEITLSDPIPLGHKFALVDLPAGSEIRKYGAPIGQLTQPVTVGAHVHVHNLISQRARPFPAIKG